MSSSPRVRAPLSLRTRLIAEQLVLLALVCLVIGLVTLIGLRAFLVSQLDTQVQQTNGRTADFLTRQQQQQSGPLQGPPPLSGAPRGPSGTIVAVVSGGQIDEGYRQPIGLDLETLSAAVKSVLVTLPVDGVGHDRDLGGDLGSYRLIATPSRSGDVVVSALPLKGVEDTLLTTGFVLGGVALIGLTIAGVAGALIVRRTLQPLDRMAATAQRVSELELDRGEVALSVRVPEVDADERTEVGQVGSALNRMLGHIGRALTARQASETRVRQFVADASHELRTPLAAISGYTELANRRRDELPPDVSHALSRVGSEAKRMTTLVEDLLLLARLDSGRPLLYETVDLSLLVIDTVGDARVAGPEHRWQLDLPAEPVLAVGDQARLHQVLANLLANGRTHTPPGTTITVGLAQQGADAVLTVTDNGPGISPDLLPEVFERFARGDSSRNRAAGSSTGLGLAIVAAVVQAHDGTVEVASVPGETRFVVRVPAAQA